MDPFVGGAVLAGSALYGSLANGTDAGGASIGTGSEPFTPYVTSPGAVPSNVAPETGVWDPAAPGASPWNEAGLWGVPDFTAPGYGEAVWAGNMNDWNDMGGKTESAWRAAQPTFIAPGQGSGIAYDAASSLPVGPMETPRYSAARSSQLAGSTPNIAQSANLGDYYEAAKKRLAANINDASAARGTWGASTTTNQLNQGMADLEAQRAKEEADYALKALAERRSWEGMKNEVAASADESALGRYLGETTRASTMGELGLSADEAERQRWLDWMSATGGVESTRAGSMVAEEAAAARAQQAAQDRFKTLLAMDTGLADSIDAIYGQGFSDMMANDQDLMNAMIALTQNQDANAVGGNSGAGVKSISEAQGLMELGDQMSAAGWL